MAHQLSSAVTFSYAISDRGQETDPESGATDPAEPEGSLPKTIVPPCSHVFLKTTCPTCRFNVDPDKPFFKTILNTQILTRNAGICYLLHMSCVISSPSTVRTAGADTQRSPLW
ncbi:hypothetical protein BGW80DRAFT_1280305 [Lactifluus volemus]|nr:hypothetical protein BGW80DRAFT_1280305 [Lactifluus volemus]